MFVQKFFPPPNSETSIVMGNGTSCRGREGVDGQAGRRTGQTDRQTDDALDDDVAATAQV